MSLVSPTPHGHFLMIKTYHHIIEVFIPILGFGITHFSFMRSVMQSTSVPWPL